MIMKNFKDIYDRLLNIAEYWRTKGHDGHSWIAMRDINDEIGGRGVRNFDDLQVFMDGYEAHAKAAGRPDLADYNTLFLARNLLESHSLVSGFSRYPEALFGKSAELKPDAARLSALQELVKTGAPDAAVGEALVEILYRDLKHSPHHFMIEFALFLLDEDRLDLLSSKTLKQIMDRAIGCAGFVRDFHERGFFCRLDQYAEGETRRRMLEDKTYIDKVPCRYLGSLAEWLPDPDTAKEAHVESLWVVAGRVGKQKFEKIVEKSRKAHKIALGKDYSWMEGGCPDYVYTGERLAINEKILAQFDEKAVITERLTKPFKKAAPKKQESKAMMPPRPKKSYKL